MQLHANAALGLAGRRRLVGLIERGHSIRAAAAALSVAPATAHRWWHRWVAPIRSPGPAAPAWPTARAARTAHPAASQQPKRRRSSPPAPRPTSARDASPTSAGGPAPPSGRSWHRHGRSRRRHQPQPLTRRYEWSRPGALIHIDTARLARFGPPGHRTRGRGAVDIHANEGMGAPSSTWPSTTTAATPTSSSTPTSGGHLCRLPGAGPGPLRRARPRARGGHDRRRAQLPHRGRLPGRALAAAGRAPHRHPALHARWNGKAERFIQT